MRKCKGVRSINKSEIYVEDPVPCIYDDPHLESHRVDGAAFVNRLDRDPNNAEH